MVKADVRYGAELRKRAGKVKGLSRSLFTCTMCEKKKVKRIGNSLWRCKSCGAVFAGGAYTFMTGPGELAVRFVKERQRG